MSDKHQKHVDELLLRLLAEEGQAIDCAARARTLTKEGLNGGAGALLALSLRHQSAALELRTTLAALVSEEGPATQAEAPFCHDKRPVPRAP